MKILFVHTMSAFTAKGGAEVSLRHLIHALTGLGHDCTLVVASPNAGIRRTSHGHVRVIEVGLRNVYWPFDDKRRSSLQRLAWHGIDSFNPFMKKALAHICAEEAPDVASVHNLPGWSLAAWDALRESGVPAVQVLHDQYLLCARGTMFRDGRNCDGQCRSCRLLRLPHRGKSRHLAGVVGVSRFILDRHRAYGYFQHVPVQRVIHNARDSETFSDTSVQGRSDNEVLRFGFIGSITPVKGVEMLIDAFCASPELAEAELWIAGDLKSEYAQSLQKRTHDERIRFCGRMAPEEFFPKIDALVLSSLWRDTFPGVAFESLIFGRPVIAVNHGGAPEIVQHEYNGLIFDAENRDALADAMGRLALEPGLLDRLSEKARLDGCQYLDTTSWANAYESVYRDAIGVSNASI